MWAAAGIAAQVVLARATWYYDCGNGIRSSSDECAPGSAIRTDDGLASAIGWSALTWVSLIALAWVVVYVVLLLLRARRRERAGRRAASPA